MAEEKDDLEKFLKDVDEIGRLIVAQSVLTFYCRNIYIDSFTTFWV